MFKLSAGLASIIACIASIIFLESGTKREKEQLANSPGYRITLIVILITIGVCVVSLLIPGILEAIDS